MFFIGIFGISSKQQEIKALNNIQCKECSVETRGKLIKTYDCFEFFFIPVFKWNIKYYVVCSRCNSIYEVSEEKGKAIEKGENIDFTYWDLKAVGNVGGTSYYAQENICTNCGKKVDGSFKYCPYCGKEMK